MVPGYDNSSKLALTKIDDETKRGSVSSYYYARKKTNVGHMSGKDRQLSISNTNILAQMNPRNIFRYIYSYLVEGEYTVDANLSIVIDYADDGNISFEIRK